MSRIVLLDGGMGQELIRRSAQPPHPLWSAKVMLDEPEIVQSVHADFIEAGAKVITCNSYSATPERLERDGAPEMFKPLQARAIELAKAARDASGRDVRIAGCLPPLYGSYSPDLNADIDVLTDQYRVIVREQAGKVDLIQCETMSSIKEAVAACTAGVESGLPVWVGLSVSDDHSKTLRSGESLADALVALDGLGAEAILLNCSVPEAINTSLPDVIATGVPAGAYANGFTSITALKMGGTVETLTARKDLTPAAYAAHALGWARAGARIVGGCCEVGPAHIAYLSRELEAAGYDIQGDF